MITKFAKFLLLVCAVGSASSAKELSFKQWRSSVGIEGQYYNYREPEVMHLVGWMLGVNAESTYHYPNQWFIGAEGRILWGKDNYSSYDTGKLGNGGHFLLEVRALLGKEFLLSADSTLSPYTGLGYRYKHDGKNGKETTTGHLSYERHSTYYYLPLGLKYQKNLNAEWSVAIRGEYDQLLYGLQKSDDLQGGNDNHKQHAGFGIKVKVEAIKKLANNRALSFGPYVNYWDIKDSKKNIHRNGWVTWEPHNKTWESGFAVKYHF